MIVIRFSVELYDGRIFHQPDCRIKVTQEGNVMILVKEEGKWQGRKGKLHIHEVEVIHGRDLGRLRKIPKWVRKLFGAYHPIQD